MNRTRKIFLCLIAGITITDIVVFPWCLSVLPSSIFPCSSFTAMRFAVAAVFLKHPILFVPSFLICMLFVGAAFSKGKWQIAFSVLLICYIVVDTICLVSNLVFLHRQGIVEIAQVFSLISNGICLGLMIPSFRKETGTNTEDGSAT